MIDIDLLKKIDLLASPIAIIESIDASKRHSLNHEYVIRQAQERLKGRSQLELEVGAQYADQLIESAERMAQSNARTKMFEGAEQVFMNDSLSFIELFEHFDVYEQDDFPNADPITYFSLLALSYALESLKAGEYAGDLSTDKPSEAYERALHVHSAHFAAERITEAREMVAFILGMEFEGVFRRKRAKKANTARNQDYKDLKDRIFTFVDNECDGLSNRKAAFASASRFETEISKVLRSDDPEQQITKWIGVHRRKKKQEDSQV